MTVSLRHTSDFTACILAMTNLDERRELRAQLQPATRPEVPSAFPNYIQWRLSDTAVGMALTWRLTIPHRGGGRGTIGTRMCRSCDLMSSLRTDHPRQSSGSPASATPTRTGPRLPHPGAVSVENITTRAAGPSYQAALQPVDAGDQLRRSGRCQLQELNGISGTVSSPTPQ
jgi:hypothetical protein